MRLPSLSLRPVSRFLCLLAFGLALGFPLPGFAAKDGESVACPTCRGDGHCPLRDCKEGQASCPATCLKPDAPGWTKRTIEGQTEADAEKLWFPYEYKVKGKKEIAHFSRDHAGELVEMNKGEPVLRGRCTICQGSGRVACRTCKGTDKCPTCEGERTFVRGQNLLVLTDFQGREIEVVVRSRKKDAVTVLRLADLQIFDIPLGKLSAESIERLDQRFPVQP